MTFSRMTDIKMTVSRMAVSKMTVRMIVGGIPVSIIIFSRM
jgi:hypothetical protein